MQKDDTTFDQYFCNGSGGASTADKATSCKLQSLADADGQPKCNCHSNRNGNGNGNSNGYATATATATATQLQLQLQLQLLLLLLLLLLLRRQGIHRRQGHVRHHRPDRKAC